MPRNGVGRWALCLQQRPKRVIRHQGDAMAAEASLVLGNVGGAKWRSVRHGARVMTLEAEKGVEAEEWVGAGEGEQAEFGCVE